MVDFIEFLLLSALYLVPVVLAANIIKAERRHAFNCIVAAVFAFAITQLSGISELESWQNILLTLTAVAVSMAIVLDTKLLAGLALAGVFYVIQITLTVGGHWLLDLLAT